MDNSDTVDLVFLGRPFRNISKSLLISNSEYFRALFSGNFTDSKSKTYDFDLSPKGFDIVLRYMKTKEINLKGKKQIQVLNYALQIADRLCIDDFESDFRKALLESVDDLDIQMSQELISLLNVDLEEYYEKCLQKYKDCSDSCSFSYEFLRLVTKHERFWKIERPYYCYDFFWNMTNRIEKVVRCALKNPPNLESMRSLAKNLNLESVPWNSLKNLLYYTPESPSRVCLMLAFQHHFSDLRDKIRTIISAIRVCFKTHKTKTNCLGVIEFDLEKWSWVIQKEMTTPFIGKFCVMSRDYTNIFGDAGQLTFRLKNYNPKIVDNLYVGEISKWLDSYYPNVATCVSKQHFYFFLYHPHSESHLINSLSGCIWYSRPTLFKLGVFDQEFSHCAYLPLVSAAMIAEGTRVYIAGFSPHSSIIIRVFIYYTVSGDPRKVAEIKNETGNSATQLKLVLKNTSLYIFFNHVYWIVDTRASPKQPLSELKLESFFTQGWDFKILQLCSVDDGIVFLLDIGHRAHNCDYLGMMLAFLNTDTGEFNSLGFLPNPLEEYRYNLLLDPLQVQIERKEGNAKKIEPSKTFADGIKDLENLPHKHSSTYF